MKVISGGQTGVDRYGLEIARALDIKTGGTAPKGWWTDIGSDMALKELGLIEAEIFGYPYRTEQNVINSDMTILFGDLDSPGCKLTIKLCKKHGKPYLGNPTLDQALNHLHLYSVEILNIAGNRERNLSQDQKVLIRFQIEEILRNWKLLKTLTK